MLLPMLFSRDELQVPRIIVLLVAVLVMHLIGAEWERMLMTILAKLPKRESSVNKHPLAVAQIAMLICVHHAFR